LRKPLNQTLARIRFHQCCGPCPKAGMGSL
jgi:hypothetical protein